MGKQKSISGVYPSSKKDGTPYYRASVTFRRKHISLGSYSSAKEANRAYQEANSLLTDASRKLSALTSGDDDMGILPFEKQVILINFRDNGIYIGKPIYLGQKMLSYYLSPTKVLKFDLDDLFYYSSHKIMCRGNHYFVADYGMQVNILNRYGIKNYAVAGKDFLFLNDDPLDFRRVNLKILNTFHGVSESIKKGQPAYTARIHIRSSYVIGHYESPLEAAIAYNKAIDILKKNGCQKNYQTNYIEGLSPKEYADVYSFLKISPRLESLTFPCNQ